MATQADQRAFNKAVYFGDLATLTRLVKKVDIEAIDECGNTALIMTAAISSNRANGLDCLNLLIANGANVNARCEIHCTALHNAALRNNASFVKSLLKAGADPSLRDKWGKTASDKARSKECLELLENTAAIAAKATKEEPKNQTAKNTVAKKPATTNRKQSQSRAVKKTIVKKPAAAK